MACWRWRSDNTEYLFKPTMCLAFVDCFREMRLDDDSLGKISYIKNALISIVVETMLEIMVYRKSSNIYKTKEVFLKEIRFLVTRGGSGDWEVP